MALSITTDLKMKNTNDVISFDELYSKFLEADNVIINLLNAYEIADKATELQSNECISFANNLLGVSCEVVLDNVPKMIDQIISGLDNIDFVFNRVNRNFRNLFQTVEPIKDAENEKVLIPKYIFNLKNMYFGLRDNAKWDLKDIKASLSNIDRTETEVSLTKAARAFDTELQYPKTACAILREYFKNNKRYLDIKQHDEIDKFYKDIKDPNNKRALTARMEIRKWSETYKVVRKFLYILLSDARKYHRQYARVAVKLDPKLSLTKLSLITRD